MEAARQVLKRGAELKILNAEQIMTLSTALVEDQSGSIQNGQISCTCQMIPYYLYFYCLKNDKFIFAVYVFINVVKIVVCCSNRYAGQHVTF